MVFICVYCDKENIGIFDLDSFCFRLYVIIRGEEDVDDLNKYDYVFINIEKFFEKFFIFRFEIENLKEVIIFVRLFILRFEIVKVKEI